MKKKVLMGILALALVFGMAVIGCDGDDNGNGINNSGGNTTKNFNGTWTRTLNIPDPTLCKLIINESHFEIITGNDKYVKGTFSLNNGKYIFTSTHANIDDDNSDDWVQLDPPEVLWECNMTVNGNTLTISGLTDGFASGNGDWTRQSGGDITAGNGSINFSDTMWKNQSVYTAYFNKSNGNETFERKDEYTGNDITFTKVQINGPYHKTFSEISNTSNDWNINFTSNKLSIKLGIPDKADAVQYPNGITSTPGLQVHSIDKFIAENGAQISFENPALGMEMDMVWFVYANIDGTVTGSYEWLYGSDNVNHIVNYELKVGWNTVIKKINESTNTVHLTSGKPSNNHYWFIHLSGENND